MKCSFCIKVCSHCNRILVAHPINFARNKNGKYGFASKCKEYDKEKNKKYYQANQEHIKEKNKERYQANPEHFRKKSKEHRQANLEYYKEKGEEYRQANPEYYKEYCQANPEKIFNKGQRRRIKEQNQGRDITKEEYKEINAFFGWKCAYSGEPLKKGERSLDHITPLHLGGVNMPYNLVPMKKNYNSSKNTQEMEEWYRKQPFFSEERLSKIYEWIEYASQKYSE